MVRAFLILLVVLVPRLAFGQATGVSVGDVQVALNRLGYTISDPAGQWGGSTSWAVVRYRFDFALPKGNGLSRVEATTLIDRGNAVVAPIRLVKADNPDHAEGKKYDPRTSAWFEPERIYFGSPRSALAVEMLGLRPKFSLEPYGIGDNADGRAMAEKHARARRWLGEDVARADAREQAFNRALIAIDLALSDFGLGLGRDRARTQGLPRLAEMNHAFPPVSLTPPQNRVVSTRLLQGLGKVLRAQSCDREHLFTEAQTDVTFEILSRYRKVEPTSPHLIGLALETARCAPLETATRLLSWRYESAKRLGDRSLILSALESAGIIYVERGMTQKAKKTFGLLLKSQTPEERGNFIASNRDTLVSAQMKDVVGPALEKEVDRYRGQQIDTSIKIRSLFWVASALLRLDYDLGVVERLYYETQNDWRPSGNIGAFYQIAFDEAVHGGHSANVLQPLERVSQRFRLNGNLRLGEEFKARKIDVLINIGQFSKAEEDIEDFVGFARKGANDARVRAWHIKLGVRPPEGATPGEDYARALSEFIGANCGGSRAGQGESSLPKVNHAEIYGDHSFAETAAALGLRAGLATCRGGALLEVMRVACYLWAGAGDQTELNMAMAVWASNVADQGGVDDEPFYDTSLMACPMGIAEAGRNDLLARFAIGIDPRSKLTALLLLRLAGASDTALERTLLERFQSGPSGLYSRDIPKLEAEYRLHQPYVRERMIRVAQDFHLYVGGSVRDNSIEARVEESALDLAQGYQAMGLHGVARTLLLVGLQDEDAGLSSVKALRILGNPLDSRFLFARIALAIDQKDPETALRFSRSILLAFAQSAREGGQGSVEDFVSWAERLRGFARAYLAVLSSSPSLAGREAPDTIVIAQQILMASTSSANVGRLAARLSATNPTLVRNYQDALLDLRGAMLRRDGVADMKEISRIGQRLSRLRTEIAQLEPGFGKDVGISLRSVAEIRSALRSGSLVIVTVLSDHLMTMTITKTQATPHFLPIEKAELVRRIAAFRAAIQAEEDIVRPEYVDLSIYLLSGLPKGRLPKALVFAVSGQVTALPMGALPISIGGKKTYLGAATALSVVPSLALLDRSHTPQSSQQRRPFLGIGDTRFGEGAAQKVLGFVPPPLRETKTELRYMAALLGADMSRDLMTGPAATEKKLDAMSASGDLSAYRVVTFATHGFLASQGKLKEAGLLMSEPSAGNDAGDGLLSASEVRDLKLNANLVILSACDTGVSETASDGLSTLAQAFTYAGARSLIVTHWQIDTFAATELSKRLMGEMSKSPSRSAAEALKAAVAGILNDPNLARYHHPKFWASHMVIGF